MILFQFVLIFSIVLAVVFAIQFLPGDRSLAVKRILAIAFASGAVLAIIFPDALTAFANFFGVGRGTDMLLYLSVIGIMFFSVALLRSKARTDARITELARSIALLESRIELRSQKQRDNFDEEPGK